MSAVKRRCSSGRAETMDDLDESPSPPPSWTDLWMDYCNHCTMPGVRQIAQDTPFAMRRCIWVILLVGGSLGVAYQLYCCIAIYLSYPVHINAQMKQNASLTFPAVTICNLNNFRLSVAAETDVYHTLATVFAHSKSPLMILDSNQWFGNKTIQIARDIVSSRLPVDKIFLRTAHKKEDMIVSCRYADQKCSDADFVTRKTPEGVCFTFNSNLKHARRIQQGPHFGLRLLLNVEQFEYIQGLTETTGVKVTVHDQKDSSPARHKGFVIGPNQHVHVKIQRTEMQYLNQPHGSCTQTEDYSRHSCHVSVHASEIINKCKCRDFWMESDNEICNISRYLNCVQETNNAEQTSAKGSCPVACRETTFDPFMSSTTLSNTYASSILRGNYSHFLRKKIMKAREAFEHYDYEQLRKNKQVIGDFASGLGQIKQAYSRVQEQMSEAALYVKKTMIDISPRVNFHLGHTLQYIQRMIEVNFVRGWKETDERTLSRVTSKFYETISSYDKTITQLLSMSQEDEPKRQILYLIMHRDLAEQLELAIRAVDNVTRVHYAFKDGLSYKWTDVTPFGTYDAFIIPTNVLGHDPKKQKDYYNALSEHLTGYMEEVIAMETILKDVYQTSNLNNSAYIKSRESFSEHSQEINHYKAQFYEEIVLKAAELWKAKIKAFRNFNMSLNLQRYNLLKSIRHLNRTATSALDRINNHILPVVAKALNYVSDVSQTKQDLAQNLLSNYFKEIFSRSVPEAVKSLRTHGEGLMTSWNSLKATVLRIWTALLSDESTKAFYTTLMEDLFLQSGDTNFSETILEISRFLDEGNLTYPRTFENLAHSLNADTSVIQLNNKSYEVQEQFKVYSASTDVITTLRSRDLALLESFEKLKEDMSSFVKRNEMSEDFFRNNFLRLDVFASDISYLQVKQESAYSLSCLLGDVGGSLALFLGMGILTVCELLDFMLHGAAYYQDVQRQHKQQQQVHYHHYDTDFQRAPSSESKTSTKSQTGNGQVGDYKLGSGDSYV